MKCSRGKSEIALVERCPMDPLIEWSSPAIIDGEFALSAERRSTIGWSFLTEISKSYCGVRTHSGVWSFLTSGQEDFKASKSDTAPLVQTVHH